MIITGAGNYPRISDDPEGQTLRRALAQMDDGRIDAHGVRAVQDEVVQQVISEQIEAGLDLVTDGLIRWDDAVTYLARGLSGFRTEGMVRFLDTNTFYREPVAQEAVHWRGPITVKDWEFACSVSSKPVKAVLTGPYTLGLLARNEAHSSSDALVLDLAEALRSEVQALHEAGAPLVQIDEPLMTRRTANWPLFKSAVAQLVEGVNGRVALNASFGSVTHLPDLFTLPFQVFGLDFIQGPGNWDILDRIPADRELAAGVVDAREVRLEEPREIAEALERIGRHVPPERLYVNPNVGLEFLPRETARAKLQRTADGARLFSGTKGVTR